MSSKYNNKYEKMTTAPVKGLISSLAVPTIFTMLVSAVYNTADSFFVGKIDTSSVASIGIVFSIMTLLQAIGFFLGNGSGILVSTYLGKKDKDTAKIYSNVALSTSASWVFSTTIQSFSSVACLASLSYRLVRLFPCTIFPI